MHCIVLYCMIFVKLYFIDLIHYSTEPIVLHCIALYSIALYYVSLYCNALYSIALYCAVLYYIDTMEYSTSPCTSIVWYCIVLIYDRELNLLSRFPICRVWLSWNSDRAYLLASRECNRPSLELEWCWMVGGPSHLLRSNSSTDAIERTSTPCPRRSAKRFTGDSGKYGNNSPVIHVNMETIHRWFR